MRKWMLINYAFLMKQKNEDSKIISPKMPKTIFYNSMASNELVEHTIALKYLYAIPLYRQHFYFDMMGATLSLRLYVTGLCQLLKH